MEYINVGASIDGKRVYSKAALKRAMQDDPGAVEFDVTEVFSYPGSYTITGNDLPQGWSLTVAGPDPYTNRKWFATVKDNGRVT